MTWIKFHGELREGRKRGLSRATRFVYLELSHVARPHRGVIDLPRGLAPIDAVHDILGGSRKEVAAALADLTSEEFDMIRICSDGSGQQIQIVNWAKWNAIDENAGRRQREHRARKNADVTRDMPVTSRVTKTFVTRPDQRREDKRKSDPPNPRDGGTDFSHTQSPEQTASGSSADGIGGAGVDPRRALMNGLARAQADAAPFLPEDVGEASAAWRGGGES